VYCGQRTQKSFGQYFFVARLSLAVSPAMPLPSLTSKMDGSIELSNPQTFGSSQQKRVEKLSDLGGRRFHYHLNAAVGLMLCGEV
jgi:hypothetical protein